MRSPAAVLRPYLPRALFGLRSRIGRKQFIAAMFYLALAGMVFSVRPGNDASGAVLVMAGLFALFGYVATVTMLILALRNRIDDAGLSMRWLMIPLAYVTLDRLQAAFGAPLDPQSLSWSSIGGMLLISRASMTAMIVVLLLAKSSPAANDNAPAARI